MATQSLLTPPHSLEAEQCVLGGIILDNNTWDLIAGELEAEDFYTHDNREIFKLLQELCENNAPCDLVTLTELSNKKNITNKEFFSYIAEICHNTPSTANIVAYRDIVRERSLLRRLLAVGHECTRLSAAPEAESEAVRTEIERQLFTLSTIGNNQTFLRTSEVLSKMLERLEDKVNNPSSLIGLDTGLEDLNKVTGGLQNSDLIVLAARPSMGKTALALRFIVSALETLNADKTVQFFSLEMPAELIMERLTAIVGGVNLKNLRTASLDDEQWDKISLAATKLFGWNERLLIDDEPALTPSKLRSKARRGARTHGHPGLIVVDYLQLMRSGKSKIENRNLEIAEISANLKALAKEMKCPVVALSQLNRGVESRPNKRPNNGDLRESGAIEQDADMIFFIYRDEVYHPETEDKGIAEIIVSKNRNGPTGYTKALWLSEQTSFVNLAHKQYADDERYGL